MLHGSLGYFSMKGVFSGSLLRDNIPTILHCGNNFTDVSVSCFILDDHIITPLDKRFADELPFAKYDGAMIEICER